MGWKLTAFVFLFAVWALNVGALIIGIPILLHLFYRFWSNRKPGPGKSRWMIYLGVFLLLLSLISVAEQGTYSPIVFGVAGVTLLALALFPGLVDEFAEKVAGPASELFGGMSGGRKEGAGTEPCVELTKLPLNYLDPKKNDPKETLLKARRLVQTLTELDFLVEMKIEFSEGSGKILFSAPGSGGKERISGLLRVVRSQLPEFGAEIAERPEANASFSVSVEGVPEPSVDPVAPLARFFVENRLDGGYSMRVSPAWVNPVSRWFAGRSQRKLAEVSGYQRIDDDRTTTTVDHGKQVELDESVKGLDRLLARKPVRVSVRVSADDEATALHAANVLAGALSSQRRTDGLKVGRPRTVSSSVWRRSTLMLPSEAAPYFWLPQIPLGTRVVPSAEFQAPPVTHGEVVLGEVVGLSGKSGQQVRVGRDQLAKHIFVTGITGSGKTTSCFGLLLQLQRMGVPFLVIEPVKYEYRSLLAAIPGLQVFTIGDEETAPFRLNIFEPPPGVKVQAHLENLVSVWNGSFVSYSPVQYVIPEVFAEAYRACGWDVAANTCGRPVTLDDVMEAVEKVVRGLGYEEKVTMDVEAAIRVRVRSLVMGGKKAMFEAQSSTPMEAVMSKPTVIELKNIQRDDEKAFIATLIMMNVAGFVQAKGPSRSLRHFTLIEEAHRLLPKISTERVDPEATDPRRVLVEQFANMLSELRAYGEGLAVVEQIPTKILPDVVKNTATKVVHRVLSLDDRRVMAGAMNATKEQAAVFTGLKPGEAVVSFEGHPVPVRVEVDDVVSRTGIPVGEVSDWDVKRRMEGFYLRNPLPKEHQDARDSRVRKLVEEEQFRREFLRTYKVWIRTGDVAPLREFVIQSARSLSMGPTEVLDLASGVLRLATAYYLPFNEEDRAKFPRVIMREVRGSVGKR